MEIITVLHECLIFKFNKKRYLYGLTATLSEDKAALQKMKVDHIILPAHPYHIELACFYWQLHALRHSHCRSLVVTDSLTRKRLEVLLTETLQQQSASFKWEFYKQHEIAQEQLLKCFQEAIKKQHSIIKPIRRQPNGFGYNTTPDIFNIIVAEHGRAVILSHLCSIYIIDPAENIEDLMKYYGIPFDSVEAVILTTSENLNIFQLIMKLKKITIITQDKIFKKLKKNIAANCLMTSQMLKNRITNKIICEADKWHSFRSLDISFKFNEKSQILYWDFMFGLKRIRLYPKTIDFFPHQLINLHDLQHLFAYQFAEKTKKELQQIPEVYRKKIIYNRVDRKYNNKYFYTLKQGYQIISISAHPHVRNQIIKKIGDQSFRYRVKDVNAKLECRVLEDKERFNSSERAIYVRKGYVRDSDDKLYGKGYALTGLKEIISSGNSIIMYEPMSSIYFYQNWKDLGKYKIMTAEDTLKKMKQNSFIKTLNKYTSTEKTNQTYTMNEEEAQVGSQWQIFNNVCHLKTFQAGISISASKSIFFIIKGSMKLKNSDALGAKNMIIGTIRPFYSNLYEQYDEVEVVKDTWAVQISINELHRKFLCKFPQRMYELLTKPSVFE